MATIPVYDATGNKTREVELDTKALDKCVRKALLKESLIAWLASQRQGTHKTKTRAEKQGGNSKPYRQKGTGHARQGCIRAPHYVGGGRAHGPRPRDYGYRLPRQQRRLAVRSALRERLQTEKLIAVEGLDKLEKPQTKTVRNFLKGVGLTNKGALIVSEGHNENLHLSARNIQKIAVSERRSLNAGQVMQKPTLILTADALDALVKEVAA